MKAQSKDDEQSNRGKSKSDKPNPARVKHTQPVALEQFFHIIENVKDGLIVLDKNWHFVFVNQKAAEILHREKSSDLIGKHIWTEYPEGVDRPLRFAYERAMRDQVPFVFEDYFKPWDLWIEHSVIPSPDGLIILFAEIEDRKRIEALLNQRQYFLQKILDTEPGTVYIYDLVERRNVYTNHYWLAASGYTEAETHAMGDELLLRIFHPDELARIFAHHESWRQTDKLDIREIEYRIRTKAGEWRWLHSRETAFKHDEMGKVTQILGVTHDITEQRLAQEALRRSEQQLELIYDSVSDTIFLLSVETDERYRFISVNKAFFQTTGLKDDQVIGKYADEVIPPSSHHLVFGNYKKAILEKAPVTWEEVSEYPAGTKTAIVTVNAGYNEKGICTHLVGTVHDITDRKHSEEALRESEEQLSLIYNSTTDYIVLIKVDGKDNFIIESCNEAFVRADREAGINITSEQLTGMSVRYFLEEVVKSEQAQIESILEIYQKAVATRNVLQYDEETRLDGVVIYHETKLIPILDTAGHCTNLLYVSRDITDRKRAEQALQRTEKLFRAIVEDQTEMIVRWKPDGIRTFVNQAYCRTFGKSYDELVGTSFWPLVAESHRERELERIHNLTPTSSYSTAVHESILPNGETQWQEWSDRGFFDEKGHLVELQSVGRDITDRKRAEEEIRQHAARMEVLAEISHTLNKAGLDYQGVLNTVARSVADLIGDFCIIALFSEDEQQKIPVAIYHRDPKQRVLIDGTLLYNWIDITDNQRDQTLLAGNPVYIPVVDEEEFRATPAPEFQDLFNNVGLSSFIAVPIRVQSRVIGMLSITRDRHDTAYTRDDQVLLQDLADRAALIIQNAQLFEQAENARKRLEALSRRLLEVQEVERRILTNELHDRTGQNLTALSISLQNMKALLSGKVAQRLATKFDDAQTLVEDTTRQIRDIMAELHPPELEDYGLAAALETYAERAASRGNLELISNLSDLAPLHLPSDVCVTLFRVAQEAIINVIKHAAATRLEVNLEEQDSKIYLKVEDNGQGFELNQTSQKEARTWGLSIMRERIESIGGEVNIESKPGEGTRVTIEVERLS